VLAKADKGTRLQVTGRVVGANWYQVKTQGGATAYVASNLLRELPKAKAEAQPPPAPQPEKSQVAVVPPRGPSAQPGPAPAEGFRDCPTCPEMVRLPAGTFRMGSDKGDISERPAHTVQISKPFAIGKFEVTIGEWGACVTTGACTYKPKIDEAPDTSPVHKLSWKDVQEYLVWLKKTTGKAYRLPSEAEWEYAARGPDGPVYPWGDTFECSRVNADDETTLDSYVVPGGAGCDGYDRTAPVGSFPGGASWAGALNMAGNVWEWVNDWYAGDYYANSPSQNPRGPETGDYRVLRGGSWLDVAESVHAANRGSGPRDGRAGSVGFRCVVAPGS
jgi:formylglycine-generating enzyme required for sulfatase activity